MTYVLFWFILSLLAALYLARLYSLDLGTQKNQRVIQPIKIKTTAALMVVLTIIFLLLSDEKSINTMPIWIDRLSTSNSQGFDNTWFLRLIGNNFVHANRDHLTDNLLLLAVCGLYENRVGAKRFISVFAVSCLVSSLSVLFIPWVVVSSVGVSGGIYGLLAALVVDKQNPQHIQDNSFAISRFAILIGGLIASYYLIEMQSQGKVNHMAHILGAIVGAVYCVSTTKPQTLRKMRG